MKKLSISDVRNNLPSVIEGVSQTKETVVVTRYGKPVASIIPFRDKKSQETPYPLRGQSITVADDFDEPISVEWNALAVAENPAEYGGP